MFFRTPPRPVKKGRDHETEINPDPLQLTKIVLTIYHITEQGGNTIGAAAKNRGLSSGNGRCQYQLYAVTDANGVGFQPD